MYFSFFESCILDLGVGVFIPFYLRIMKSNNSKFYWELTLNNCPPLTSYCYAVMAKHGGYEAMYLHSPSNRSAVKSLVPLNHSSALFSTQAESREPFCSIKFEL